jgi:hypothetical protein
VSKLFDTEALIMMAEMCGHEIIQSQFSSALIINKEIRARAVEKCVELNEWNPRENIAQAMEVLDTFSFYEITKQSGLTKSWFDVEVEGYHVDNINLTKAIFQAVKACLEGDHD